MFSIILNNPFPEALIIALAFLLAIMIAITFHEVAHGFTAYRCGDATAKYDGRLSFNPMRHFDPLGFFMLVVLGFGWARPVPVDSRNFNNYKKSMILVSISGVLTNLILAFIFFPIYLVVMIYMPSTFFLKTFLTYFFLYLFSVNVTLAVFNFLPIYPLDGYNFCETVFGYHNRFVSFMRRYGTFILLGIFILSNIPFLGVSPLGWLIDKVGYPIEWFWIKIFGLFV